MCSLFNNAHDIEVASNGTRKPQIEVNEWSLFLQIQPFVISRDNEYSSKVIICAWNDGTNFSLISFYIAL